ncbi:hemin ABC transporter substrate-binding protein [Alkalilimnicola ehrlichii]|uniref:heme/hemin ABC transporter substrate-binding protein n=1 Tax=Alkalilimnicola ehrlichii TaxID=351052 RepID=UPI000E2F0B08|nr:ABC transporter substrate-binding protein [Alkalilimnicola ehrlichii]
MSIRCVRIALLGLGVLISGAAFAAPRVVSVAGSLTEAVYALGGEEALIAVDTTSTYPPQAKTLPKVGYQRSLSAEGIISQRPTLVLATEEAGPAAVLQQLESAKVPVRKLPAEPSVRGAVERIKAVAEALDKEAEGQALAAELEARLAAITERTQQVSDKPKVLFLFSTGQGAPLVAGRDTAAEAMLKLAGADNAVTAFAGFRPLTPEALVAAAPDALLIPTATLEQFGGIEGLRRLPGMAATPAFRNRQVIAMDHLYLLGFSTRLPDAVRDLAAQLHPDRDWQGL